MKLTDDEAATSYYAVAGFIRHQRQTHRAVPDSVLRLLRRLELVISVNGSESDGGAEQLDTEWIGTTEAARILRCCSRNVRLLADDLDGRRIGRTWVFAKQAVEQYEEDRRNAGTVA